MAPPQDDNKPLPPINATPSGGLSGSPDAATNSVSVDTDGYATVRDAAFAALMKYNPMSITSGKEYGGLLYLKGNRYFFTEAVVGGGDTEEEAAEVAAWDALSKVPTDCQHRIAGDYHTHGAAPKDYPEAWERFSGSQLELHDVDLAGEARMAKSMGLSDSEEDKKLFDQAMAVKAQKSDLGGARRDIRPEDSITRDEWEEWITKTPGDVAARPTKAAYMYHVPWYACFLGTPQGRFGIFVPASNVEVYLSPDRRLLPDGQDVAAAAYAK